MKAIFRHKTLGRFIILIILLCATFFTTCYSQTLDANCTKKLATLKFVPLNEHTQSQYAKDSSGNTWLKIIVPQNLLNKPLILQFPTIHVNNYCVYAKQGGQWQKTNINTDLEGGKISPQYQENHFITDHEIIYFKSKSSYVHYGNFILVERGEHRSIMLNTMFKTQISYGLFLLSIAIIFALYSLFKEKVILIYCIYIISVFIMYLIEDGVFYFLSNRRCDELLLLVFFMPISCLLFSVFIYYFLDIQRLHVKLKYFYSFQVLLYVVLGILLYQTNDSLYFIIIVNCTLLSTLITLALALKYYKEDRSVRILVYSFSVIALTSMTYYLSIYPGNGYLSFVNRDVIRSIYSVAFIVSSYTLWIKAKKLKTDHESLKTAFESLKASQVQKEYIDLKNKEKETISPVINNLESTTCIENYLRETYQCTDREIDVIICIWNGQSNQEIAEKLSISLSTTKQHVSNAYIKLEVKNRSQAMILKNTINT